MAHWQEVTSSSSSSSMADSEEGMVENQEDVFLQLRKESREAINMYGSLALKSSMAAVGLNIIGVLLGVNPYGAILIPIPMLVTSLGIAFGAAIRRINQLYDPFRSSGELPSQLQAWIKADKAHVYLNVALALAGAVSGFFAIFAISAYAT